MGHYYAENYITSGVLLGSEIAGIALIRANQPDSSDNSSNGGGSQKWKAYNSLGTMLFFGGWLYDFAFTRPAVRRYNSGIRSELVTSMVMPLRLRRAVINTFVPHENIPLEGGDLSVFFSGVMPMGKDMLRNTRIEGGPELRINRFFTSLIWYKERNSDFTNPLHLTGEYMPVTVESTSIGMVIVQYPEVLVIASAGILGIIPPFLTSFSVFGGERYAIEARHDYWGVEIAYWKLKKHNPWQDPAPYFALALKYRIEPFALFYP